MVLPPTDDAIFGVGFPGAKSVRGHQFGLGASRALLSLSLSLSLSRHFFGDTNGCQKICLFLDAVVVPRSERNVVVVVSLLQRSRSAVQSSDSKIQKEFFYAIQFRVSI